MVSALAAEWVVVSAHSADAESVEAVVEAAEPVVDLDPGAVAALAEARAVVLSDRVLEVKMEFVYLPHLLVAD